jgi:hypothetical protein
MTDVSHQLSASGCLMCLFLSIAASPFFMDLLDFSSWDFYPRISCKLGKNSTTELHHSPFSWIFVLYRFDSIFFPFLIVFQLFFFHCLSLGLQWIS